MECQATLLVMILMYVGCKLHTYTYGLIQKKRFLLMLCIFKKILYNLFQHDYWSSNQELQSVLGPEPHLLICLLAVTLIRNKK